MVHNPTNNNSACNANVGNDVQAFVNTTSVESWLSQEKWLLLFMAITTIVLGLWIIIECILIRKKTPPLKGGGLEKHMNNLTLK